MATQKRGLGRGLDALFENDSDTPKGKASDQIYSLSILEIDPNPNQPRTNFEEVALDELASSITEHGVLQPILVVNKGSRYMIVAGERRWRAARLAGLSHIPAIVRDFTDKNVAEISLIENLQRDDLNPIEMARGIKKLMDEYKMTQEMVSQQLGKSRSAIANTLRLLTLPEYLTDYVVNNTLSAGHARALLSCNNEKDQKTITNKIIKDGLSVRETENLVKTYQSFATMPTKSIKKEVPAEFKEFKRLLQKGLGTKVSIKGDLSHGQITIKYYNRDDLERLYSIAEKLNEK
ncbi:MAG: ParB/RepB/Spo0J family partition protein [Clostridiales bacterium]|nr:ParB/RepB/Spo0J family partition protein [Clostridiales bacterium]